MKKHFYDDEDYVVNNSLSFEDFFAKNYTTPMINIKPRSLDEVSYFLPFNHVY
jgi:hypothetical protein